MFTLLAIPFLLLFGRASPHCIPNTFTFESSSGVSILNTSYYTAGDLVNITNLYSSIDTSSLPAFCRVELLITTNATANSTANTEVWLPDEWNGRYVGFGNGGLGGGVDVADLGFVAVMQGFAGMSTDTGHSSTALSGTWGGPHNDNAIIDWAYRALHLSVGFGKQVVQQYYGSATSKSYYLGCSTGGRQGLKEVQQFPEDFDGVVVGSPANWMSHLAPWSILVNLNVLPVDSPQWIPADMWTGLIHNEVLNQCDALDGVTDGILNDPRMCYFRPETLACRPGQNTSTCLNLAQINAIHQIYSPYYETNQTYIFAGYYPGGELGYPYGLVGPTPFEISGDYYRYFVLNDTTWNMTSLNYSVIQLGDELDPGMENAISPNITAFAGPGHNGKVLHYVGWADQIISPGNSLYYYETVHAFMQAESEMNIDDFYRLFTVPGMQHCQGGYGANAFGGSGQAAASMPPLSYDPQHNALAAMVAWVEEGIAPSSFVAAYYNNNTETDGVAFTRPLCKYPASIKYMGGDPNAATSFICA